MNPHRCWCWNQTVWFWKPDLNPVIGPASRRFMFLGKHFSQTDAHRVIAVWIPLDVQWCLPKWSNMNSYLHWPESEISGTVLLWREGQIWERLDGRTRLLFGQRKIKAFLSLCPVTPVSLSESGCHGFPPQGLLKSSCWLDNLWHTQPGPQTRTELCSVCSFAPEKGIMCPTHPCGYVTSYFHLLSQEHLS